MSFQKCPICEGTGSIANSFNASNRCPTCDGRRIIHSVTGLPPAGVETKAESKKQLPSRMNEAIERAAKTIPIEPIKYTHLDSNGIPVTYITEKDLFLDPAPPFKPGMPVAARLSDTLPFFPASVVKVEKGSRNWWVTVTDGKENWDLHPDLLRKEK